jgi:hypothetical protein
MKTVEAGEHLDATGDPLSTQLAPNEYAIIANVEGLADRKASPHPGTAVPTRKLLSGSSPSVGSASGKTAASGDESTSAVQRLSMESKSLSSQAA